MKKFLLSLLAFACTATMKAQMNGPMTFVGNSKATASTVSVENATDTVVFKMNSMSDGDITLPSVSATVYGQTMVIPSFTIEGATFTFAMATMTATFEEQTFAATALDGKSITGSSLSGAYTASTNTLALSATYQYGNMPLSITYTINGYYVKSYTDCIDVAIGEGEGEMNYKNESVTYKVRKYMDGDVQKLDVEVPTIDLTETAIGDLTSGGYKVCGLTYDEELGGFYKDYTGDGLTMDFSSPMISGNYAMTSLGNILVSYDDSKNITIVNKFQPGKMPFPITTTFPGQQTNGINAVATESSSKAFNLAGQQVSKNAKGIVIINGHKYLNK